MPSLPTINSYKQRRQFVRQLKANDNLNYWPDETFEELAGIPDILNERLADSRVAAVLARVKGHNVRNANTSH